MPKRTVTSPLEIIEYCDEAIPVLERKYHEIVAEIQQLRRDRQVAVFELWADGHFSDVVYGDSCPACGSEWYNVPAENYRGYNRQLDHASGCAYLAWLRNL